MLVYPQIKNHFISMTGVTLAENHNVLHVLSIGLTANPSQWGRLNPNVIIRVYFLASKVKLKYSNSNGKRKNMSVPWLSMCCRHIELWCSHEIYWFESNLHCVPHSLPFLPSHLSALSINKLTKRLMHVCWECAWATQLNFYTAFVYSVQQ